MGSRVRVKDYEIAAFLLVRVVLSVVQSAVVDRPKLNGPALADELTRLVSGYVGDGRAV